MNKGGTVGDPLNAALVRGGEATRQSRIIRCPCWTAVKQPGWGMGVRSGFVLTWVLRLQISALGTHWVCRPPALLRRSSSLPIPCHRRYSQGGPWAKRAWFKRQEDGGRSGVILNTCLWSIFHWIQWSLNLLTFFLAEGQRDSQERGERRPIAPPWDCAEDRLSWGRGLTNWDR